MKNKSKKNIKIKSELNFKSKISWSILSFFVLLTCVYVGIFHSHRYLGFDSNLWLFLISCLSFYSFELIWLNDIGRWSKMRSFLLFVFIGLPIAIVVVVSHDKYMKDQLANYGVKTNGVVTELFSRMGRNRKNHYAKFTYRINSRIYTQYISNEQQPLILGDTLNLICSEKDPEVFERLP